jgi:tetratricopeptide (TPR) repeat protein
MPKAEQLLKVAMQFVGTSGMENKLKQDLDQFEKNKKFLNTTAPIIALMNDKKFDEAIALIDQKKTESKDAEFKVAMDNKKKEAVTMYAVIEFVEAKKLFDVENYDGASPRLQKAASIVYNNIEIFDVDKSVIDSWLELIKSNVKVLTAENANEVDEVHNKMLKKLDEAFDERWEQMAMKILLNSYYYVGLGEVIKKKKSSNVVSTIIQWAVTIGIIWLIGAIFG